MNETKVQEKKIRFADDPVEVHTEQDVKEEAPSENQEQADENGSSSEQVIWYDDDWELTWPIWHMLPRMERKQLASKHGFQTIGAFEEYMSLQRALVGETQDPYENSLFYPTSNNEQSKEETPLARAQEEEEEEEEEEEDDASETNLADEQIQDGRTTTEELIELGGLILLCPDELINRIFSWMPVDSYATLALVSPHWKSFTRTEATYKRLCSRLYLNQSKRRALHVSRFGSYRAMLEKRPRVRAGNGVYVMKYSRIIPIQRDMWTEVRVCCSSAVSVSQLTLCMLATVDSQRDDSRIDVLSVRQWQCTAASF
jgi:hypothetical protein